MKHKKRKFYKNYPICILFLITISLSYTFFNPNLHIFKEHANNSLSYKNSSLISNPSHSASTNYSPTAKSMVSEGDELIYLEKIQNPLNDSEFYVKYTITSIVNILGNIEIYADQYQKALNETNWGDPIFTDLLIGVLSLNHFYLDSNIFIQHRFFSFEFLGFEDDFDALTYQIEYFENLMQMNTIEENVIWLDYFIPELNLELSNNTHIGSCKLQYLDGIIASIYYSTETKEQSENQTISFELKEELSKIQKREYNAWGEPTTNIPVFASEEVINTDYLIYLEKNGENENTEEIKTKYTMSSIDPDLYNRQTVITSTLEYFNSNENDWIFQGSILLFVEHSNDFSLRKYDTNYLILPDITILNITKTIETLEASKYWLEAYEIWNSFTYSISTHSYEFLLTTSEKTIQVTAEYTPNMILEEYECVISENAEVISYISKKLDIIESKISAWNEIPPDAPVLTRISSQISENRTIQFTWTIPFRTYDFNLYMFRVQGSNSSNPIPDFESFIPISDGLVQNQVLIQGEANFTYYFAVTALNVAGIESENSNILDFYILPENSSENSFSWGWLIFGIFLTGGIVLAIRLVFKMKKKEKSEQNLDLSQFK